MKNSIETAFILCAGMGTRMGPLGVHLPKVMWPVFEGVLLDLQIKYARSIGMKKIYLNTFHCAEVISDFLKDGEYSDVEIIHEKELLDVGGAIHNLQSQKKMNEKILILNGDQFLFSSEMQVFLFQSFKSAAIAVLLEVKVEKNELYNRLVKSNKNLVDIIPATSPGVEKYQTTYSGVAVIDLTKLVYRPGKSKFFETVAEFQIQNVECILLGNYEYWDFGTFDRFLDCHKVIIEKISNKSTQSDFIDFTIAQGAVDSKKISRPESYNSPEKSHYLFSKDFSIIREKIYYKNLVYAQK